MTRKLPALTPRGQQIMSLVLNAVAFGTHANIGNVDSLADYARPIKGKIGENVSPTVAALRSQDPKLSEREAKAILWRLK